jgi:hypothetical protein
MKDNHAPKDIGIWIRVSTEDQAKGESPEHHEERARAYGVDSGAELEEFYRNRSLLKLNVLPEDIAEAVHFFASSASAKSTANILNVDAGNAQAFTR